MLGFGIDLAGYTTGKTSLAVVEIENHAVNATLLRGSAFSKKRGSGDALTKVVAEEVAEAEPLLVNRNDKGEVEGVKYDRLSAVFINAFKEQQDQIEQQAAQIKAQDKALLVLSTRIASLEQKMRGWPHWGPRTTDPASVFSNIPRSSAQARNSEVGVRPCTSRSD